MLIRPEEPADHAAITEVVTAAFGSPAEAVLVERIRASPNYHPEYALVAELDGRVVGHVMVSDVTLRTGGGDRPILSLSPLAVAPDRHGQGIGSALVRAVAALVDAAGHPFIVLEGSPAYYARFGFVDARSHGIRIHLPDWARPEAGQVLALANDDPTIGGEVVYPPAFADVTP